MKARNGSWGRWEYGVWVQQARENMPHGRPAKEKKTNKQTKKLKTLHSRPLQPFRNKCSVLPDFPSFQKSWKDGFFNVKISWFFFFPVGLQVLKILWKTNKIHPLHVASLSLQTVATEGSRARVGNNVGRTGPAAQSQPRGPGVLGSRGPGYGVGLLLRGCCTHLWELTGPGCQLRQERKDFNSDK